LVIHLLKLVKALACPIGSIRANLQTNIDHQRMWMEAGTTTYVSGTIHLFPSQKESGDLQNDFNRECDFIALKMKSIL